MSADKKSKKELLIERMQKIEVELKKIEARDNIAAKKLDTQRKFIVGEVALAYASKNPEFAKLLQEALNELVTKPRDLEVIADLISDSSITEEITASDPSVEKIKVENDTTVQSDSKP